MSTTASISDVESTEVSPGARSDTTHTLNPAGMDSVTRLLEVAETLARTHLRTIPRGGLGGVRETEICMECQRARTYSGHVHAPSCPVGPVLELCDRLRDQSGMSLTQAEYARGFADGQARTLQQIADEVQVWASERASAVRLLEAAVGPAGEMGGNEECCFVSPDGFTCRAYAGHIGKHRDGNGNEWPTVPEPVPPAGAATTLRGRSKQEWLQHVERLFEIAVPGEDIPEAALLHGWQGTLTAEDFEWERKQLAQPSAAEPAAERRVVCGRAIVVFGHPVRDVFTCDLEPGHGDAWHEDKVVGHRWSAAATEIHFHPSGLIETRLLGCEPEFTRIADGEVFHHGV